MEAIVLVLNLDRDIPHQQTAHRKQGHRHISAFDFRRAVWLIFQAWEQHLEIIELFHTLVERFDRQALGLFHTYVLAIVTTLSYEFNCLVGANAF